MVNRRKGVRTQTFNVLKSRQTLYKRLTDEARPRPHYTSGSPHSDSVRSEWDTPRPTPYNDDDEGGELGGRRREWEVLVYPVTERLYTQTRQRRDDVLKG